jgi:hypothetical protein
VFKDKLIRRALGRNVAIRVDGFSGPGKSAALPERPDPTSDAVRKKNAQSFRSLIWINARAVQSAMVASSERKPT